MNDPHRRRFDRPPEIRSDGNSVWGTAGILLGGGILLLLTYQIPAVREFLILGIMGAILIALGIYFWNSQA